MKTTRTLEASRLVSLLLVAAAIGFGSAVVNAETGSASSSSRSSTPGSAADQSGGGMGGAASGATRDSSGASSSSSDPAATTGAGSQSTTPPSGYVGKPITPSTAEQAESAFSKLAVDKGYVARDDVRELQGFDTIFQSADTNQDGRLNMQEFRQAWKAYTASDKAGRG